MDFSPAVLTGLLIAAAAGFAAGWAADVVVPRVSPAADYRRGAAPRWTTAVAAAAVCTAMVIRFGITPVLPAFIVLGISVVVLSRIDLQSKLLPNKVVFPTFLAGAALLLVDAIAEQNLSNLVRAGIGALILFVVYLVLAIVSPAGIGMGDVKLAPVLGMYSAYVGWGALLLTGVLGFLIGGVVGLFLVIAGRAGRKTEVPFGPSMIVGTLVTILAGAFVGPLIFPALFPRG